MSFSERHFSATLCLVFLLSVFDIQSPSLTFLLPGVNPMKGACMLVLQVLLKSLLVTSVVQFNQITCLHFKILRTLTVEREQIGFDNTSNLEKDLSIQACTAFMGLGLRVF